MNRMYRAGGLSPTRLAITAILAVLLFGFDARREASEDERAQSGGGWDRESAARYLDERMQVWFDNGKKLRTGQSETVCVSCHTTVPYVLARPALRRAMQVSAVTPEEVRLFEETTRRVESYGAHQQDVQVSQHSWRAWRAHSLNFDREHGGEKGEPWRRMFMSDSATAFAVLALVGSD